MAIGDSYATAAEYRAGIDQDDTAEDAEILLYTTAVSRIIDHRCQRTFNQDAAVVERFYSHPGGRETILIDGLVPIERGSARFWLPDADISTTTGLVVKVDLDLDYSPETTLTINTDFWVGPENAALGSEVRPYEYLDLKPNGAVLYAWPTTRKGISIAAKFGWSAVPEAIKRATIALTKQLRDATKEPFVLTLDNLGDKLPLTGGGMKILDRIEAEYSKKVMVF